MNTQQIPKENIEVYCYLYSIETALRKLIIESLREIEGSNWFKRRLPVDVLEKYRKGVEFEKSIKWHQLVPHHPIYYIDFTDLKKIIEREDNWRDAFKPIFSRKDILGSTLSELEFIRNKIAHNRKASCGDVEIVRAAYSKLSDSIGKNRFDDLSAKCTCALDISERLGELQKECEMTFCRCKDCERLGHIDVWKTVCDEWWFDESYLGHKLDGIVSYFTAIEEYFVLPRTRGSGYKIESWFKSKDIESKYTNARIEFLDMLGSGGERNGSN